MSYFEILKRMIFREIGNLYLVPTYWSKFFYLFMMKNIFSPNRTCVGSILFWLWICLKIYNYMSQIIRFRAYFICSYVSALCGTKLNFFIPKILFYGAQMNFYVTFNFSCFNFVTVDWKPQQNIFVLWQPSTNFFLRQVFS